MAATIYVILPGEAKQILAKEVGKSASVALLYVQDQTQRIEKDYSDAAYQNARKKILLPSRDATGNPCMAQRGVRAQ